MKRVMSVIFAATAIFAISGLAFVQGADAKTPPKPLPRVVVYVESDGLCYDSIVTAQNLPDRGPFQTLEPDLENHCGSTPALKTAYGPGDQGYVGGRWMLTLPDGTVVHFSCPLVGPGTPPVS